MPEFRILNTQSQHRSRRYPDDIWDKHKDGIVNAWLEGGLAHAYQWIESQGFETFSPTCVFPPLAAVRSD